MTTFLDWKSVGEHIYIKTIFGSDRYSIWATDLSRLWHEELERDDIIWQANKNRIQIDIEDANNFGILLKHLDSSLVDAFDVTEKKSTRIELRTAIKLPEPLPEATWTFRLELQEDEDFRKHVTIPLFDQIRTQEKNETELIQHIKDKDHIVDKLMDALDKCNVDLTGVFPALATQGTARMASTRTEAETRIPALRPFDQQSWHRDRQNGHAYAAVQSTDTSPLPASSLRPEDEVSAPPSKAHSSHRTSGIPSNSIKRTLGSRKRSPISSPPPAVEDSTASESEETAPIASSGTQRTFGSRRRTSTSSTPSAIDEDTISESEKEPAPVAPQPKGIRRASGSQERPSTPSPPPLIDQTSASEAAEHPTPAITPHRGIKRTIGSRKPAAWVSSVMPEGTTSDAEGAGGESKVGLQDASQLTNHAIINQREESALDAEETLRRADDKRRALQRQLAQSSGPKAKKRRF
ncbi:hypothetical protein FKW77_008828 [Venturia effusa]|uniref:Non-homologous end-joining factor 1 n=1 Tax=Venturia effusa TaxID=50376 RepID=A0A517L3Y6_9PEZI|nr:hypothetical protein FKW77_008828 [Venturia effusa]